MRYLVDLREKEGVEELRGGFKAIYGIEVAEVEVEGDDRWEAVVAAAKLWGLEDKVKMQKLFDATSVRKLEKKRFREWRVS